MPGGWLVAVVAAYLLGSIPWAYLAGKGLKGIDLRQRGSGNLGATNVYRTLGAPAAVAVLALDALKGFAAVAWLPSFIAGASDPGWRIACGVAAIVGHVRPAFLLWKGGGKGVATAAGVFAALAPIPLLIAILAFGLVLLATRYISLSSLTGAVALSVAMGVQRGLRDPLFGVALVISVFVFWTHRSNIVRLRQGAEPRFGEKSAG